MEGGGERERGERMGVFGNEVCWDYEVVFLCGCFVALDRRLKYAGIFKRTAFGACALTEHKANFTLSFLFFFLLFSITF